MKARIIKGGWIWLGTIRQVGEVLDMPPEWIANRVADGLVEPIAPEAAVIAPPETAMMPSARAGAKPRSK